VIELPDDQPDPSYLEEIGKEDKARLEEYNQGYWSMIGIRAKAVININGTLETIETAGLWSIESDSDPSYLEEIGKEEKSELGEMLKEIGFSQSQIKEAEN
jgi:hypothetical protein